MSDQSPADNERRVYNSRYEIVRRLARGGMAEVYLGRDLLLDRPVALKVLSPELSRDEAFVERFRREAQAAANLSHPNVVNVYDWGEAEGSYFIVMEYVPGRTLSQLIRTDGPLPAERAAVIGADIAAALAFAHRSGVIHRDVKPGNVLITDDDHVKVTDFGIARAARASAKANLTQTGAVLGTATYFSPEQAEGAAVDARSDVYSLGVVLYEMVTGEPPFTGENPVAIAYKHVREEPTLPTLHNPAVPAAYEAVVMQCLAKDPALRYQSADALRADLLRYARGREVMAADPATMMAPAVAPDATRVGRAVTVTETAGGPPPGGRRNGAYVALLLILLLVLAGLLALIGHSLGLFGGSSGKVTVPSVLGMTAAQATSTLQADGLSASVQQRANPGGTPGQVFNQDPTSGTTVSKGSTVTVLVTNNGPAVKVPNVINQQVDAATAALTQANLKVQVNNQPSSAPSGTVTAEDPGPGSSVPQGSTVTLTVSSGAQTVAVPDVSGLSQDQATSILQQDGFQVVVRQTTSSNVQPGNVVVTDPPAGTQENKGTTVTIFVASAPVTTTTSSTTTTTVVPTSVPLQSTTTTSPGTTTTSRP